MRISWLARERVGAEPERQTQASCRHCAADLWARIQTMPDAVSSAIVEKAG